MNLRTARGRLFALLLLVVAFPLLQQNFSFFESGKLNGAIVPVTDSGFTWAKWWSGSYQKQKNLYLNDNTGCRPDLVRLNDQLELWLYRKLRARDVVMGKDEYLYEQFYIDEYNGSDFLGNDLLRTKLIMIKKIQDTLEKLGKTFVYVHAASKAYYFPDKFPPSLDLKSNNHPTNYKTFRRIGDSLGIHQIDFNAWFLAMKDTSKNLLFSRLGTHWTVYGSLLAADSLVKYIDRVRNIRMPGVMWDTIKYSEIPQRTDNDLAAGLNLIKTLKPERFTYPKYYFDYSGKRTMPSAVYIGDSFVWTWVNDRLTYCTNKDWDVWYYFDEAWNDAAFSGREHARKLSDFDWVKELMNMDCVIVLYTPANIKGFNYDGAFMDQMYRHFYPDHPF